MSKKATILIIDDIELNRVSLRLLLDEKYDIVEFDSCEKGLEYIKDNYEKIDLILLDLIMPGMNGIEFLKTIKSDKAFRELAVIVSTVDDDEKTEELALRLGAEDYITKPFKPAIVKQRVANTISRILLMKENKERLQLKLEDAQDKIQGIYDNLPGAAAIFDVDEHGLKMTYISEGCINVTGFSQEETMQRCGDDAFADVHPDDIKLFNKKHIHENTSGREIIYRVFRVRCKSGNYKWVSLSLSPVINRGKVRYYGVYLDINEEQEQATVVSTLVNAIPGGVAIYKIDDDINALYISEGVANLTGRTMEEYTEFVDKEGLANTIYEDDLSNVRQKINQALKTGASLNSIYRLKHKTRGFVWVQLSASKIRDEDGAQIYYVIYTKPTEENALYQTIIRDSTTAVIVADINTRQILYNNYALNNIFGIEEKVTLAGRYIKDVIDTELSIITKEELTTLKDDSYTVFHKKTKLNKYLNISARTLDWNGIKAYITYTTDETEVVENRNHMQELIDKVPGGIAIYELNNDRLSLEYVNEAYPLMLGFTKGKRYEYMGEKTFNALYKDDENIVNQALTNIKNGENSIDITYRILDAHHKFTWIRTVGSVIERSNNRMLIYCSISDFNNIMNVQNELISNRAMLDAAMNSAQMSAWRLDINKHRIIQQRNNNLLDELPPIIENVPESLTQLCGLPKDTVEKYAILYKDIYAGKHASADVRIPDPHTGTMRWERVIYTPVFNSAGEYIEAVGTSIDITELKNREQNYEEQLRMKKVFSKNTIVTGFMNLSCNTINDIDSDREEIVTLLKNKTVDDVLKLLENNITFEDDRRKFSIYDTHEKLIKVLEHGESNISIKHTIKNINGWMETTFDMIINPYTNNVEAIAAIRDVSDEVRAEQIINTIVDNDYDSIFTFDADTERPLPFVRGGLTDLIEAEQKTKDKMSAVKRYLENCCIDYDIERVVKENTLSYVKEKLKQSSIFTSTYSIKLDEKIYHKRAIYTYLKGDNIILCAIQDFTDSYEQEEKQRNELSRALDAARLANDAKTEFFSRMSHDMRTPMNGILGLSMLSENENDIDVLKSNMLKIRESGEYLLGLINDTLDFQRIESGRMNIRKQNVDNKEFWNNIIDMVKQSASKKNIEFRVKNDGYNLDGYVKVDPLRVKQIFINLLSNAIKYTLPGGTVELEIKTLSKHDNISHVRFIIRDTGVGMSREYLDNGLFKPFSQEKNDMTLQYAGSGLGLSIVKNLLDLMSGSIEVSSELGVGTTFTIEMDIESVDNVDIKKINKEDIRKKERIKEILDGRHILLVEDHPLNAEIASMLLANMNCIVTRADNGKRAIDIYKASKIKEFDLILMDIRMPVMDGIESTKGIRALDRPDAKDIPIIAMTANAYEDDVRKSIEAGMNAHLAKPIEPDRMFDTMARYISMSSNFFKENV